MNIPGILKKIIKSLFIISADSKKSYETVRCAETERISESDQYNMLHHSVQSAYLTGADGNTFYISEFPFIIGRLPVSEGTDLSLGSIPEISGTHARITYEKGNYFIEDCNSTNGTFIHEKSKDDNYNKKKIQKYELYDGCKFSLYNTEFTFHTDSRSAQTCVIRKNDNYQTSATVPVSEENGYEHCISDCNAFITDENKKILCEIYNSYYVFRNRFIIENYDTEFSLSSCNKTDFYIEDEKINGNEKAELFSGCRFSDDTDNYRFYIKN